MKKHILTLQVAQEEWKVTAQRLRQLKAEAVAQLERQEQVAFEVLLEVIQEVAKRLLASSLK